VKLGRISMIRVIAIYENGVLKPIEPLKLAEGQTVQLSVYPQQALIPLRPRTPEEVDFAQRIITSKTLEEAFALIDTAPVEPESNDLLRAFNENRKANGERLLYPEFENETNP
jgi:predicted DNA-binding antitoxin AbrB/MazE fold protein